LGGCLAGVLGVFVPRGVVLVPVLKFGDGDLHSLVDSLWVVLGIFAACRSYGGLGVGNHLDFVSCPSFGVWVLVWLVLPHTLSSQVRIVTDSTWYTGTLSIDWGAGPPVA
jgi:hypothetical protein